MTDSIPNNHPAPTPEDLKKAADAIPEGPNVEYSPNELQAAKGETPLEGPRAGDEDAEARLSPKPTSPTSDDAEDAEEKG